MSDDFLTVDEIAAKWRVSRMTVYRLVHSGELKSYRIGRSIRITRDAVNDYTKDKSDDQQ